MPTTTDTKRVLTDQERQETERRYALLAREHIARGNARGTLNAEDAERWDSLRDAMSALRKSLGYAAAGRIYRTEEAKYDEAHDMAMEAGIALQDAHALACSAMESAAAKTWVVNEGDITLAAGKVVEALLGPDGGSEERENTVSHIVVVMMESFNDTEGTNVFPIQHRVVEES
jgi:hypothetical protein